jgi:hypothetical protein
MRRTAPQLLLAVAVLLPVVAGAQATMRPTPAPVVTADNEEWYLAGEPITFSGSVYYPAGPQVFFNQNEMVRTGDYRGIPLYSRTTIEPFSKVFVPVAGRLMQPYERRRAGDLAGTVGSSAPSFPAVNPAADSLQPGTFGVAQAAAPPTLYTPLIGYDVPSAAGAAPAAPPSVAATTGISDPEPPRGPLVSARLPEGLNGLFIEYRDRRWFSSGHAVRLDAARFRRIGDYEGFPVYTERDGDERTIYVSVTRQTDALIAPYSARR